MHTRIEQGIKELIPDYMQGGVRRYIYDGIAPGGFLTAVFCNNLVEAYARADHINQLHMRNYANFLHNYAPLACWGNANNVAAWSGLNNVNANTETQT